MQIKLTKSARNDLIDIWLYGCELWGETNADSYLDEINDAVESLATNSLRYSQHPNSSPSFRLMPIRNHMIAYEVEEHLLVILRVLHKNMDTEFQISKEH